MNSRELIGKDIRLAGGNYVVLNAQANQPGKVKGACQAKAFKEWKQDSMVRAAYPKLEKYLAWRVPQLEKEARNA